MSDAVQIVKAGGVLEVTLNRPKANAIDAATSRLLGETFAAFRDDPALRVAIVTGAGEKFFSAGWDLGSASGGEAVNADFGVGGFAGLTEMHDLEKPVIAALNGMAVGGGFELALSCDLIVAADHAQVFTPEVKVGVVADAGTFRLPKQLPPAIAMELLLTGRRMDMTEAAHWGIVNRVVPAADLMDTARALAAEIVEGAPLALAAVKQVARLSQGLSIEACYERLHNGGFPAYDRMAASEDAKEGPRAFAEKRSPVWQGK